jgi:succinoglycan biosynthesis transport protein ExoP
MSPIQPQTASPRDVLKLLRQYPLRWILPAVIATVVAVVYAKFRPAVWEASQALMVRDEAIGGDHLGRFHVAEDMKTVQETILELAHGHSVVSTALATVGPPADRKSQAPWPSEQEIAALAGSMKLSPPKGAEFGKTEVFYLQVQNTDRQRSIDLASALCDQLKKRFEDLRDAKARSLVEELDKTVTIANNDLESATARLAKMDAKAGADLGELRTLLDTPTGDSPLRHSITEMETELRAACVAVDSNESLMRLLEAAKADPHALAAAPSRLLDSQPSLRRLKDGLVDAEIHKSQLLGTMSESHPLVVAATAAEDSINEQVHEELNAATTSVAVELRLAKQRVDSLQAQIDAVRKRLDHLADIRAEYANTVAEVHLRTDTLKTAETELGEARASQAAAHTASLLSRIDTPDTGAYPIGPGRSVIVAGGAAGGLILGLGLLFLTVPPLVPRSADARLVEYDRSEVVDISPEYVAGESQPQVVGSRNESLAPAESAKVLEPVLITAPKRPVPAGPLSFGQALAKLQSTPQESAH